MLPRHSSGVSETHLTISCSKCRPAPSINSYSDRQQCYMVIDL